MKRGLKRGLMKENERVVGSKVSMEKNPKKMGKKDELHPVMMRMDHGAQQCLARGGGWRMCCGGNEGEHERTFGMEEMERLNEKQALYLSRSLSF